MFIVVLGTVLGLMHLYVWKRLVKDTTRPGRTRWVLTGRACRAAGAAARGADRCRASSAWRGLGVVCMAGICLVRPGRLPVSRTAGARAGPARAARLGATRKPARHRARPRTAGAEPAGVPRQGQRGRRRARHRSGLVGIGVASALGPPDLLRVPVRLRRLDPAFDGFRIAVVSDIHLGPLAGRAHTERIVAMINETEPDLVAIVGDLVDGTVEELGSAAEPLRDLESREGTFFVTGNHEYFVDDTVSWLRELERLGVQPLRNENTAIRRGAARHPARRRQRRRGRAAVGSTGLRPRAVRGGPIAADDSACPPTGSGDARPPRAASTSSCPGTPTAARCGRSTTSSAPCNRRSPDCRRSRNTQLYVTRGAGFWGPPVRVGAPPDITVVSLQAQR